MSVIPFPRARQGVRKSYFAEIGLIWWRDEHGDDTVLSDAQARQRMELLDGMIDGALWLGDARLAAELAQAEVELATAIAAAMAWRRC